MAKDYREYLGEELEKATREFEAAKKEAANEILAMSYFMATDFGAAYASRIDKVTAAAAKIRELAECANTYEYFMKGKQRD